MRHRIRVIPFLLLVLVLGLLPIAPAGAEEITSPFQDTRGLSQEHQINALWQLGVVAGVTADQFSPSGSVTRAQMAAFIIRAMGKTTAAEAAKESGSEFTDVPSGHWASGYISLANRMGIIKGDAGKFSPDTQVNFAQAVTMLVRALGHESQVSGGYPAGYVVKANELGLLRDSAFELFANVSRAEAAVLLYNAIYRVPEASTNLTWSQSIFKRVQTVSMTALPEHAAPGQQFQLQAEARDLMDNPIPSAAIVYTVASGNAQIQGQILTVGAGGKIVVQAAGGTVTAQTTVTPVSDLAVSPATFQANKGGTIQLSATALADGQRVSISPDWKVMQGPATVDQNGKVTVVDYGTVSVQATLGTLSATSTGQAVGKVTIENVPEYLVPGVSSSLKASATDSAGHPINVPVTWSATNAVIDRSTGVVANAYGTEAKITATAGGISESVTIPVIQSIQIEGVPQAALVGKRLNFTASAVDADGNRYPVQPRWDRNNPAVGIISADGSFAGVAPGTVAVTATLGSLQGNAALRVSGPPAVVGITTPTNTLPAGVGASTVITARLLDQTGSVSPVDDQPIVFNVSNTQLGTLSRMVVLTREGEAKVTYTAGSTTGVAVISATSPGTTLATQSVSISTYAQSPHHIDLAVTPNPLATGGAVATVTATLKDANSQVASAAQLIYVSLTASGSGGALAGPTISIQPGQSTGSMSFISNALTGIVQLSGSSSYPVNPVVLRTAVPGAPAGVKIRPIQGTTPVTGLTSLSVQVDVVDAAGVVLANDSSTKVALTVTPPSGEGGSPATYTAVAVGGTASFRVPASVVGTVGLTANLEDGSGNSDKTTAVFVPGVAYTLKLTGQPTSLIADGFSTSQIIAEVVDTNGNVMPNVNTTVTFRKLVEGNATNDVSSLTVPTLGGRAILSLRSTRMAGSDIWFASAPGLDTQNLVTVTSTNPTGDAYAMRLASAANFAVGASGTLVIQVVDQQGRVVSADSGRTIMASTTMAGVTITQSSMTQNGAATFSVVSTQSSSGTITLTAAGLPTPQLSVPVTFGVTGNAYSLFPTATVSSARVGTQVTLLVRVMDNQGNTLIADNGRAVTAQVTSGNANLSSNQATTVNGLATFTLTGVSAGSVTVTFTAQGLQVPQASLPLTITN